MKLLSKMFRASRFARPYRRFRRYAKKRVYGRKGISFAQVKSKALSAMDPPSKKRKQVFMSSQNLWSEEDQKMAGVDQQGLGPVESKLSMVRFKEPNAVLFEYHHMVRRVQLANQQVQGVAGTKSLFSGQSILSGLITDIATIANLYERIRLTRVRFEFTPKILQNTEDVANATVRCFPNVLVYTPKNAQMALGAPVDYDAAMDDLQSVEYPGNATFAIDTIPLVLNLETINVSSGSSTLAAEMEAPWVLSTTDPNFFVGNAYWKVISGSAFQYSQVYSVTATTWFDVDTMV